MIDIRLAGVQDVRMPIAGDSYYWNGFHKLEDIKSIVIHHSASDWVDEDAYSIANYHVNNLGWGGIGYHIVIKQDGTIQYAGDLATWRAHVGNNNYGRIGICLTGDFTSHHPTPQQLSSCRSIINYLLTECPEIPNLTDYSQITPHRQWTATACPGNTWQEWWAEALYKAPQATLPVEPIQTPVEPQPKPEEPVKPVETPTQAPEPVNGGKGNWIWDVINFIIKVIYEIKETLWSRK